MRSSDWSRAWRFYLLLPLAPFSGSCRRRPEPPTYRADVAPIFAARCIACHHRGGLAPVPPLETYADVAAAAARVRATVQSRDMPPWGADNTGICRTWRGASWLDPRDIGTILAWIDSGHPEGDASLTPAAAASRAPELTSVGAAIDTGAAYAPGLGPSAYRCFIADPKLLTDRLVTAFHVTSTEARSVAQVTLYAIDASARNAAEALDNAEDGPGYRCYGSSLVAGARLVASWTWDSPVLRMPRGFGVGLHAGDTMIMQIHYDVIATGLQVATRTRVEMELDDAAHEATFWRVSPDNVHLEPGRTRTEAKGSVRVPRRMTVLGVAPRMHTFAQTMQLDLVHQGRRDCVANFDHWHFYRQRFFEYDAPVELDTGDAIDIACVYNTQSRSEPVELGERIEDEECLAMLLVAR